MVTLHDSVKQWILGWGTRTGLPWQGSQMSASSWQLVRLDVLGDRERNPRLDTARFDHGWGELCTLQDFIMLEVSFQSTGLLGYGGRFCHVSPSPSMICIPWTLRRMPGLYLMFDNSVSSSQVLICLPVASTTWALALDGLNLIALFLLRPVLCVFCFSEGIHLIWTKYVQVEDSLTAEKVRSLFLFLFFLCICSFAYSFRCIPENWLNTILMCDDLEIDFLCGFIWVHWLRCIVFLSVVCISYVILRIRMEQEGQWIAKYPLRVWG